MSRKYSITKSFGFAFSGLKTAFKKEPNFRLHIITALLVSYLSRKRLFNKAEQLEEWI